MLLCGLALVAATGGSHPCDGGVDCSALYIGPTLVSWYCHAAADSSYLYCANVDRERVCFLWGDSCNPVIPANAPGSWFRAALFFVEGGDYSLLPFSVSATTMTTVKNEIAAIGGVSPGSVHLKGRMFLAGIGPLDLGSQGFVVQDSGFSVYGAAEQDGVTRVRLCGYTVGGRPSLLVDDLLEDAETILVRLPGASRQVILAVQAATRERSAWNSNLVSAQQQFEDDVQTELETPIAGIVLGIAPDTCAP